MILGLGRALAVFLLLCGGELLAQTSVTDGVLMNAENMFRDMEKKTVKLDGNVQLLFQGQHLSCDRATMDMEKTQVVAEGHVILNSDKAHIEGDKIAFNYKTNTGFIYNGFVQSGQVVLEGSVVEKVGEKRYVATNATYTACETCPPGWNFSGRVIDAEVGGYARIQRPVFRVGGVPILILPSLIVPLKSSRQSGFLVPNIPFSSRGGAGFSEDYFWAIDRSQDLTLGATWYQRLGYKGMADYRYLLSKESTGRLRTSWMTDRALAPEYSSTGVVNRWFIDYKHHYDLPDGYVQRLEIRELGDLRYLRDFPEDMPGYYGDPALENRASITKLSDSHYASAEIDMYQNLLKHNPFQRNDDAVHRFPEIRYSAKEQRLFGDAGPLFRTDVDYVDFVSPYNYDNLRPCNSTDPTCTPGQLVPWNGINGTLYHTGYFNRSTDLWRTGHRLDAQATVSYPFQVGRLFDVLPSVSYREMQYRFASQVPSAQTVGNQIAMDSSGESAFDPTAARRYIQADILAKTEFSRVFGDLSDPKGSRWKHTLQPEFGYSQIPWMRSPNHPFFGNFSGLKTSHLWEPMTDSNLWNPTPLNSNTGVQFDYNDRVYDRRLGTYSITNRLTRKVWNDGVPDYLSVLYFQIGQSYDFKEAQRVNPHPFSTIDSLLGIHLVNLEAMITNSYDTYADVANTTASIKVMATPKNFMMFSFSQNYLINDDETLVPGGENRTFGIGPGIVTKYFDFVGEIDYAIPPHHISGWNFITNIRPPGRCWEIHFEQTKQINGPLSTHVSFNFNFGGETKVQAATSAQAL